MKRRDFLSMFLAAATALSPRTGAAQQPERMRRVGVLLPFAENDVPALASVKDLAQALHRRGWTDDKNIRIDTRFAANDPARLDAYAAELVAVSPDALLAAIPPAVAALRKRTGTIPIVFTYVADPVGQGIVKNLARPGGNITGISSFDAPMMAKWLQLLKEAAPSVTRVAIIFNPDTAPYAPFLNAPVEAAAPSLGIMVTLAPAHDDEAIDKTAADVATEPGGGIIAMPDSFTTSHRNAIMAAAARHRLPLIGLPFFTSGGGLMSYWVDAAEVQEQAASYIDRILRGARPSDLPVQNPTKFLLTINLKTAKALGLTVPQSLLARADEVIE